MKEQLATCAAVLLIGIAAARAQATYPGPVPYEPLAVLPPYEVVSIVRSTGLAPLTRPVRRGSYYVLVAVDRVGQQLRVVIDAQRGDIVNLRPVLAGEPFRAEAGRPLANNLPATAAPLPGGAAPASGARVGMDNPPTPPRPLPATHPAAAPPAAAADAVSPPSTRLAIAEPALPPPPPLPRPRPKLALNEAPAAAPDETDLGPPPLKPFVPTPPSAASAAEIE